MPILSSFIFFYLQPTDFTADFCCWIKRQEVLWVVFKVRLIRVLFWNLFPIREWPVSGGVSGKETTAVCELLGESTLLHKSQGFLDEHIKTHFPFSDGSC